MMYTIVNHKCALPVFPYSPAGISAGDHIVGNILCNNTSRTDHNMIANGNTGHNDGPAANPYIIADHHR